MAAIFFTIRSQTCRGRYQDKGRRFLSFAYAVDSEGAIKEWLSVLRRIMMRSTTVLDGFLVSGKNYFALLMMENQTIRRAVPSWADPVEGPH